MGKNPKKNYNSGEITSISMYLNPETARFMAEREENYKHENLAAIIDQVILAELEDAPDPLHLAELGGGAHPDRYNGLFSRLLREPHGQIDWVDLSQPMLDLAHEFLIRKGLEKRESEINYVHAEMTNYLTNLPNGSLDGAIMKYTVGDIEDLAPLFKLLSAKLKPTGCFISSISELNAVLRSHSSNARFLYQGKEFPLNETRILKDGEKYGIKFLKEIDNVGGGYAEGLETVKYFHSLEKLKELAAMNGFEYCAGDWKKVVTNVPDDLQNIDQNVLILRRKNDKNN